MGKKYTIIDIAKLSGFSKSTVSKVIRNEPFVKDSTRKKVNEIINRVGYKPDEIARYLVAGKNVNFIGLIISGIQNPVFSEIAVGIESEATRRGYNVILCNADSPGEVKNYINILLKNRASGIVLTTALTDDSNIKYLSDIKHPYVLVNCKTEGIKSNEVSVNHFLAAKSAVNFLIKKGHQKIAHFNYDAMGYGLNRRIDGYKSELRKNNIEVNEDLIFKDEMTIDGGFKCAKKLIDSGKKVTAIFTANDLVAIGAMDYFRKNGYRVPEDYSVIGFDNIKISSLEAINLTTVSTPKFELGVESIKLLFERIKKGPDFTVQNYSFKTRIIERNSVKDFKYN